MGLLVYSLAYFLSWPLWIGLPIGGGVMLVIWLSLLDDRRPPLPERPAEPERADIRLGHVAPPEYAVKLRVEEPNTIRYAHLPVDIDTLGLLARGVLGGQSFAVATWTGRGKPLTRGQFEDLRAWLLKNGYVIWIDERSRQLGMEWTPRGKALLKALANRKSGV